jgi:hypothetical protein
MVTLFLDLSGGCSRFVVTERYRLLDNRLLETTLARAEDLPTVLDQVFAICGQRVSHLQLILPSRMISTETVTLQRMSVDDALRVVSRQRASRDGGGAAGELRLTELAAPRQQLRCLAEEVSLEVVEALQKSCDATGIKLLRLVSPLQAILEAFAPQRQEMQNVEIVFDLGIDEITAVFLTSDRILHCEHVDVPFDSAPADTEEDHERLQRRRQFAVLTPLHSIYSHFMKENPDAQVDRIWLCGAFGGIGEAAAALSEATDLPVLLANHIADFDEEGCAFTALAGIMRTREDEQKFNLLPRHPGQKAKHRSSAIVGTAAAIVLLCLVALVATTEYRLQRLNRDLAVAEKELAALEISQKQRRPLRDATRFVAGLEASPVPFYTLFRDLSVGLPKAFELQDLRYRQNESDRSLELVAVTPFASFREGGEVLTQLVAALSQMTAVTAVKEPTIEVSGEGPKRVVKVTILCTMASAGEGRS